MYSTKNWPNIVFSTHRDLKLLRAWQLQLHQSTHFGLALDTLEVWLEGGPETPRDLFRSHEKRNESGSSVIALDEKGDKISENEAESNSDETEV